MKLYAHWDGYQPFTKVIKIDNDCTVAELRDACWEALKARHPDLVASGPGALRLTGGDRRPLCLGACLADILDSGDDVFYWSQPLATQPTGGHSARTGQTSSGTASGAGGASVVSTASAAAEAPPAAAAVSPSVSVKVQNLNQCARAAMADPTCTAEEGRVQSNRSSDRPQTVAAKSAFAQADVGARPVAAAGSSISGGSSSSAVGGEALLLLARALWLRAEEAVAQLHYRGASEILQQALQISPEPSSLTHIATLMRLARLWLAAGNPGAAVQWALRAAKQRPHDPAVLELAGDCLREGGRPREAAAQYKSALEALQEGEGEGEQWPGGARAAGADLAVLAPAAAGDTASSPPPPPLLRLRLSLAACLAALPGSSLTPPHDNQDLAAALVMAVLEEDPSCWEALALYGRIALDRGLRSDALRVALRLVVGRPQHTRAKGLLAECLRNPADCRQLYDELGMAAVEEEEAPPGPQEPLAAAGPSGKGDTPTATSSYIKSSNPSSSSNGSSTSSSSAAAALAFVATAVKDHGRVDSCIELLRRAVALHADHPGYVLNLVHALELRQELTAALRAGREYCRRCGNSLAGRPLADVDALLSDLPELRNPTHLIWYTAQPPLGADQPPRPRPQQQTRQQERTEPQAPPPANGSALGRAASQRDGAGERVRTGGAATEATVVPSSGKVSYSADQLDELALLFTLAKVLFVGGALGAAARLCELVEPLRSASSVELHTTLIRNEAAYFGCVAQLLRDFPPPSPSLARPVSPATADAAAGAGAVNSTAGGDAPPLYLCGDSHCLSAAWRVVTLRGQRRLLRPLLVTGCKVWHLRPASQFYPKKQFEAATRLLPDGAQVVLVMGEIDCREGLLLAVQKGKYDSVAEGIRTTVAIYLDVLRGLVCGRAMEVFVHPVPPVLNETRGVVVPFTAQLRAAVAAARRADVTLRARLHYLDFFDQLLVPAAQPAGAADAEGAPAAGAAPGGMGGPQCRVSVLEGDTAAATAEGAGTTAGKAPPATAAPTVPAAAATAAAARDWALRPDLVFDGTHLAPTYVPLLDAALAGVQ